MADDHTLGRVLHEARIKHNPPLERPRGVPPWEERAGWQRDLDELMAAEVETVVRARIAADFRRLAADRERFADLPPGVPRVEREAKLEAWLAAVQVALHGLTPERGDEKEGPKP